MLNMRMTSRTPPQGGGGCMGAYNVSPAALAPNSAALGQLGAPAAECPSSVWHFVGGAVFWAFAGGIVLRLLGIGQKAAQHGVSQLERHVQTLPSLAGSQASGERRRSRETGRGRRSAALDRMR